MQECRDPCKESGRNERNYRVQQLHQMEMTTSCQLAPMAEKKKSLQNCMEKLMGQRLKPEMQASTGAVHGDMLSVSGRQSDAVSTFHRSISITRRQNTAQECNLSRVGSLLSVSAVTNRPPAQCEILLPGPPTLMATTQLPSVCAAVQSTSEETVGNWFSFQC